MEELVQRKRISYRRREEERAGKRHTSAPSEATERGGPGWPEGAHINDVVDCSTSPAAGTLNEPLPTNVQHIQAGAHNTGGEEGWPECSPLSEIGFLIWRTSSIIMCSSVAATQFPSVAGENIAFDEHHSDNEDSEFMHPPTSSTGFSDFPGEQRGTVLREFAA